MHERERSPDHAREIVQYATLSHIYSYTGIARVFLCILSWEKTFTNCYILLISTHFEHKSSSSVRVQYHICGDN